MNSNHRTKIVGVKLTPSELETLNTICNSQKITKSSFIRKLINNYIAEMVEQC